MIEFKILKKSTKSKARLGILKTPHGEVETPTIVSVATQAVIKTLESKEIDKTKTGIIISNTFHLHLKPGEEVVRESGGINSFMNWQGITMTDSGGYQVFSLGFGRDLQVGKVMKFFPEGESELVKVGQKPKYLNITEFGVYFYSPLDGSKIFIGPKESIQIQEKLGADIIFAFDECTPPLSSYEYVKGALDRTHKWAAICKEVKKSDQALFGIVQGSRFEDLRNESASYINSLDFDGFGIGGDLGDSRESMIRIIDWVVPRLDQVRPRHLLGIGKLEDIEPIIQAGIDTFDCTVPTHYARHGVAFTSEGKIKLNQSQYLKDQEPLDKSCKCIVCQTYKRSYLCHLIKAKEITGLKLVTFHNLFYFNQYVSEVREKIKRDEL